MVFLLKLHFFNNTSNSIRSISFSHIYKYIYREGPLSNFQPGAPYKLNPPMSKGQLLTGLQMN